MSLSAEVNDSNFDKEVLQATEPVLVDFWAPWCGPCQSIAPLIDELAKDFSGKLKVVKVNVDNNKEAAGRYNVRGIPNLIIFKDGVVFEQMVGARAKHELVESIERAIA